MPPPVPRALPENDRLFFLGEPFAATAMLSPREAARLLALRNPHGKPNADVVRQLVVAAARPGFRLQWVIDFPAAMSEAEAALYEQPFQRLARGAAAKGARWWTNPHGNASLRAALARRERFLVTPVGTAQPDFHWVESTLVPAEGLLAVARDDDFAHGILSSRPLALWWRMHHARRPATRMFQSFPFPWPPATGLNALTKTQEEHRLAVARAARGADAEALNAAVAAAYGWPAGLTDGELLGRLHQLHRDRGARL
jgi:hypothetical protein